MARTILIAAGGTGGHLFPGIAVADELVRRESDLRVVFVGTSRGLESRLVPRAGYPLETLPVLPLNGVGLVRMLRGILALPGALLRAALLLRRLRPSAVLGVGGYAGGPVVLVAAFQGVPTVILEPNAKPGFTNRVLRPFVGHAACAYEEARQFFGRKGILTGNPVRGAFRATPGKKHQAPFTLLVFGGSQGSRVLNRALLSALPHLPPADRLQIVHQTGEAQWGEVSGAYAAAGRPAEVHAFLNDMEAQFARADLVVCRSGATTCAELTAAGKAAILIPFAQAADDHQRINAFSLAVAGAARMIEEKDLTGEALGRTITTLLEGSGSSSNPALEAGSALRAMEQAALALGRPDAAVRVAHLLLEPARA